MTERVTATDLVGFLIDRLLERRYGAPYSPKWWARRHAQDHQRCLTLDCPHCPSAEEVGQRLAAGWLPPAMSYNDCRAVEPYLRAALEKLGTARPATHSTVTAKYA